MLYRRLPRYEHFSVSRLCTLSVLMNPPPCLPPPLANTTPSLLSFQTIRISHEKGGGQYDVIYMIWFDMIWFDMIWWYMIYDMIWYDMMVYDIWHDRIWYMMWYMIRYDIWFDMIWYMILFDVIWWYMIYDRIWYDMMVYDMIWCDMVVYDIWYDIFNSNWVATRWQ